jgi:hypothetical protein
MTTPQTTPGKIVLIFYGLLGCSGAILFFNLFLERIITFLAYILRSIYEMELRRKGILGDKSDERRGSNASEDDSLDSWKPSVGSVMIILLIAAAIIACLASAMYHPVEEWSFFESFYFCFVAFATIGFGDYVVSQRSDYDLVHIYRFGNFVFLLIGCCCVYSMFNVTSIVIKQFLNWLIKKLDCRCCYKPKPRPRRNAITPGHISKGHKNAPELTDVDSNYDSDVESRRGSSEMISMRDFLQANKISLAMMQKQLYETSQRGTFRGENSSGGFQGPVGPLAILNQKLGQEDV